MDGPGATQLVAEVGIVVAAFLRQRDRLVGRIGGKGLRGLGQRKHCCSMCQWDIYKWDIEMGHICYWDNIYGILRDC